MSRDNFAALRWRLALLIEQTGKAPLLLCALPCCLLIVWLGILAPETARQSRQLIALQQRLQTPLPIDVQQPELKNQISSSEYQQVRQIFALFRQHKLQVESSRYRTDRLDNQPSLLLEIPLEGSYLSLMNALDAIHQALPVQIEHLTLQRSAPDASKLTIALKLRLLPEGS